MSDENSLGKSADELKRLAKAAVDEARTLTERNREVVRRFEALNKPIAAHEK